MKLGLGTVQFGLDYGISNQTGKTQEAEARLIVAEMTKWGIRLIDTAAAYGNSEELLGMVLDAGAPYQIVTKLPCFPDVTLGEQSVGALRSRFALSLINLKRPKVYALLVHCAGDLLGPMGDHIWRFLLAERSEGRVSKIGCSVYNAEQIDRLGERYPIDIIQLPVNVLDQRLIRSGHLKALKAEGIEIHARSAFLQGLLFMEPDELPAYFEPVRSHLRRFADSAEQAGLTRLQAALGFVHALPEVEAVICGVNDHLQLREMCEALNQPLTNIDVSEFGYDRVEILDPSRWPKKAVNAL